MDLMDALRTRRSASAFGEGAPSREVVEQLIRAATWAPNHHLTQPWRFIVVTGDARRRFGEHVAAAMRADGVPEREAASTETKLQRAPVLLVVVQARGVGVDPERDMEDYGACCCATQNLLLAAHDRGLAAKWSTGELTTMASAREFLGVAPADRIVAYVYLGAVTGAAPARERAEPAVTWHE